MRTVAEVQAAFEQHGGVACVLEKMVDLRAEISVIVCRLDSRHTATYDPAENRHDNGILSYSTVPARLHETVQRQARQMAVRLADALDYVGVLAVQQHPSAHLHLYGKTAARNGRKMGHFNVLADTADQAYAAAQQLHAQLDNTE